MFGIIFLPSGIMSVLIFSSLSFTLQPVFFVATIYAAIAVAFFICSGYSGDTANQLLQCGFLFCADATTTNTDSAMIVSMNIIYFIVSFSLGIYFASLVPLVFLSTSSASSTIETAPPTTDTIPTESSTLLPNNNTAASPKKRFVNHRETTLFLGQTLSFWGTLVTFLILYPILFIACMALPTWWNGFKLSSVQTYYSSTPDYSYGWYAKFVVQSDYILKLFPDIILYYGCIYLVMLVAIAAKVNLAIRDFFVNKPFPGIPISVGEISLSALFIFLCISIFLYFYIDHGWDLTEIDSKSDAERAARSFGQVKNHQ
jgi:hypothetical protein